MKWSIRKRRRRRVDDGKEQEQEMQKEMDRREWGGIRERNGKERFRMKRNYRKA